MSKNTRNRILLTAIAALLLVAVAIGGTLAYLADQTEKVVNTFTPSNLDVQISEDGATLGTDGKTLEQTWKMVPGNTITKKPVVTLAAGSENAWVFVEVVESSTLPTYISYTVDSANWTEYTGTTGPNGGKVYYKQDVVAGTALDVLTNDQVTVISTVTNAQMAALNAEGAVQPTLTFYAYAVQSANVTSVADAWKLAQTDGSKTVAELNP